MHTPLISLISLSLLASSAVADTPPPALGTDAPGEIRSVSAADLPPRAASPALNAFDPATLPPRCRPIAVRARATGPGHAAPSAQALSARISLANCRSDARLAELELIDGAESIVAIDAAVAPSLALLDEVATADDLASRVMAHHARAQLYSGMTTRMLNTVPPAADASPEAGALRDSRRAIVEVLVQPWREQATTAYQAVVALARAHPALTRDPVILTALRESHARLAARAIATR